MSTKDKGQGLRGVKAGRTAICTVGDGHNLFYRGYAITDLVKTCVFEEVAHLLLHGKLPNANELEQFRAHLAGMRELPESVKQALALVPASAHPMDVCKVTVDHLGVASPEPPASPEASLASAERMLACMPTAICHWYRTANNQSPITPTQQGIAASLLEMLHGEPPSEKQAKAMDTALILYAEHEFAASTFTARVVSATRSDTYSAVAAAIGALKGPLHGGANEAAMNLIEKFSDPGDVPDEMRRMLAAKELIMGFGHAVYKSGDPRSPIIKEVSRSLSVGHSEEVLFAVSEAIEKTMSQEKGIFSNLDFYAATAFRFLGIATPLFTPLFVCARLAGFGAHIVEQRTDKTLIRPGAEYIGPDPRPVPDISERD